MGSNKVTQVQTCPEERGRGGGTTARAPTHREREQIYVVNIFLFQLFFFRPGHLKTLFPFFQTCQHSVSRNAIEKLN